MAFQFFSKNGRVLPMQQAVMPLSCIEYMYGYGVYETVRITHKKPYFLSDHIERLFTSSASISLEHTFTANFLERAIADLIDALGEHDAYNLKILLIGASSKDAAQLIILPLAPLFPDKKLYRDGVKTMTVLYERVFPQAKTLNMLPSYVYYRKAKGRGCYDALLVNRKEEITEGTRTNFFCVEGKTIITPPSDEVLGGVTRKYVLQTARESGFIIEEGPIALSRVQTFESVFLTGTSIGIMPIRSIDEFSYPKISPHLKDLMRCYEEFKRASGY